jgi:hypothetical protein
VGRDRRRAGIRPAPVGCPDVDLPLGSFRQGADQPLHHRVVDGCGGRAAGPAGQVVPAGQVGEVQVRRR